MAKHTAEPAAGSGTPAPAPSDPQQASAGPAMSLARRERAGRADRRRTRRPYAEPEAAGDASGDVTVLAATRALLSVATRAEAAAVLRTAIGDLGGGIVPPRLAGEGAIPVDVSLGIGEPLVVVATPSSMAAMRLAHHLPLLAQDAATAASRCDHIRHQRRVPEVAVADRAVDPTVFTAYFAALAAADARAATAVVSDALARGESPKRLMADVLARAQRDVGQLWMADKWNVADEHAATAITEQALTLLAPATTRKPATNRVVLACAEGEWHSLPARLAGELARSDDLDVVHLGGSTPAGHLQRHVGAHPPRALALSVTMPTNLIAASRSIRAAHAEGVPVIVGGAAWGPGQHRARRLGAQIRLDDPRDLLAVLAVLADISTPASGNGPPEIPVEALLLDVPARQLLLLALERQCAGSSWMSSMTPYRRDQSLTDLGWLARHAAAAVACDDPAIVRDVLAWLLELLLPRRVPAAAVIDSCYYLADAIEPEAPLAAGILRQEADHAHQEAADR